MDEFNKYLQKLMETYHMVHCTYEMNGEPDKSFFYKTKLDTVREIQTVFIELSSKNPKFISELGQLWKALSDER